jgi:hypothetical protein
LADSDPEIGMTGPMSNYAPPPQLVENVPYTDLEAMHHVAGRWRTEHRGQWFTAGKIDSQDISDAGVDDGFWRNASRRIESFAVPDVMVRTRAERTRGTAPNEFERRRETNPRPFAERTRRNSGQDRETLQDSKQRLE